MSDAYEDDMAAERAILDQLAALEVEYEDQPEPVQTKAQPSKGGRPRKVDPIKLVAWRQARNATVAETARRWNVSERSVQQFCRDHGEAAKLERKRWESEQLDRELQQHADARRQVFLRIRNEQLSWVGLEWFSKCEAARGTGQEEAVEAAKEAALEKADREFREDWERKMGPLS